uniref:G-protein coupled receptor 54-like isoform X2 n=1 Tax=Petromyzon marinus TaxID=7757 RepID=A0AAJ7X5R7_PETMA|nr:G-protein coupled receptor 54-like isoform X2 [Petromyzon marinus]
MGPAFNVSAVNASRLRGILMNVTRGEEMPFMTDAWLVPLLFALIMLVGLVGNSLVIFVITKNRQMRTVTNFFIARLDTYVNLAGTDIIFLVCCVPFTATLYPLPSWVFGDFMCKFVNYLQQVTVQATCMTLTAMSVDRCYVTVYPIRSLQHRTPCLAACISIGIWIGSLVMSLPMALYHKTDTKEWYGPKTYCFDAFPSVPHEHAFVLYSFVLVYMLPLVTISVCYSIMIKKIGRPAVEPQDDNVQMLTERNEATRAKVTRMVVVVVLVFMLCWGPIQLFILFQSFYPHFAISYTTYKLKTWANCMSYANSSINPFVYCFMGDSFRKTFKKAFPCLFKARVAPAPDAAYTEMNNMNRRGA